MLPVVLVLAAAAAPPGYSVTKKDSHGCELSLGPTQADGVQAMHAECQWPEVTPAKFEAVVGDWAGHANIFASVVSSTVREAGPKALVHQVHQNSGIANREVLIHMWRTQADGWTRFAWAPSGQPLVPADGNVLAPRNEGYWEYRPAEAGGVSVRYELSYAPGGSVPGWIVRMFQSGGLDASVKDMRAALAP